MFSIVSLFKPGTCLQYSSLTFIVPPAIVLKVCVLFEEAVVLSVRFPVASYSVPIYPQELGEKTLGNKVHGLVDVEE